jgi:hypothetical protein
MGTFVPLLVVGFTLLFRETVPVSSESFASNYAGNYEFAEAKPTVQSSVNKYKGIPLVPQLANDALFNQDMSKGALCSQTRKELNPWWMVDLQGEFVVDLIRIYSRADCCTEDILPLKVELSLDKENWTLCGELSFNTSSTNDTIYNVTCSVKRPAMFVKITNTGNTSSILTLCEVMIFGGYYRLSDKKVANQSSVFTDRASGANLTGDLAIDGVLNGRCFRTEVERNPWWSVNLLGIYRIYSLSIMNRQDCCGDQLTPLRVETSVDGKDWSLCADIFDSIPTGGLYQLWCNGEKTTFLRITSLSENKTELSFCEINIYGVPITEWDMKNTGPSRKIILKQTTTREMAANKRIMTSWVPTMPFPTTVPKKYNTDNDAFDDHRQPWDRFRDRDEEIRRILAMYKTTRSTAPPSTTREERHNTINDAFDEDGRRPGGRFRDRDEEIRRILEMYERTKSTVPQSSKSFSDIVMTSMKRTPIPDAFPTTVDSKERFNTDNDAFRDDRRQPWDRFRDRDEEIRRILAMYETTRSTVPASTSDKTRYNTIDDAFDEDPRRPGGRFRDRDEEIRRILEMYERMKSTVPQHPTSSNTPLRASIIRASQTTEYTTNKKYDKHFYTSRYPFIFTSKDDRNKDRKLKSTVPSVIKSVTTLINNATNISQGPIIRKVTAAPRPDNCKSVNNATNISQGKNSSQSSTLNQNGKLLKPHLALDGNYDIELVLKLHLRGKDGHIFNIAKPSVARKHVGKVSKHISKQYEKKPDVTGKMLQNRRRHHQLKPHFAHLHHNRCAKTLAEKNPWWEVNLGKPHSIHHVNIYTSPDERGGTLTASVSQNGKLWKKCLIKSIHRHQHIVQASCAGQHAQFVRVSRHYYFRGHLTLCEVAVLGVEVD